LRLTKKFWLNLFRGKILESFCLVEGDDFILI
jgi:hypothetical protein